MASDRIRSGSITLHAATANGPNHMSSRGGTCGQ